MTNDTQLLHSFETLHESLLREQPTLNLGWERSALKRSVASVLVKLRLAAKLTQGDVADRAGWDKAYVSRLEGAVGGVPDLVTLMRYAQVCDSEMSLLFTDSQADDELVQSGVKFRNDRSVEYSGVDIDYASSEIAKNTEVAV